MKFTGQYTVTMIDSHGNPYSFSKCFSEENFSCVISGDSSELARQIDFAVREAKKYFDEKNQPSEKAHPNL